MSTEINIKEIEVQKLKLVPGDVLSVKIKRDNFDLDEFEGLKGQIQSLFPNNKVMLFLIDENDEIMFEVVSSQVVAIPEAKDCSDPQAYCSDCGCGKKAMLESKDDLS